MGSGVCGCETMTVGTEVGPGDVGEVVGGVEFATDDGATLPDVSAAGGWFATTGPPAVDADTGSESSPVVGVAAACTSTGEVADVGAAVGPPTRGPAPPATIGDPDPPDPPAPIPEA